MERETFINLPDSNKLDVLFDLHNEAKEKIECIEKKLDRKKRVDSTVSALFGLVGGYLAILTLKAKTFFIG